MFKLVVATLAAMYLIALSAGDAPEDQEVARAADPEFETTFTSMIGAAEASTMERGEIRMSDAEAIELALMTGAEMRSDRTPSQMLRGSAVEMIETAAAAETTPRDLWSVTGNSVNLRAGPGTGNDVVAQLSLGTAAEVIDEGEGWYRIRTADGAVDGWIFGKYLSKDG